MRVRRRVKRAAYRTARTPLVALRGLAYRNPTSPLVKAFPAGVSRRLRLQLPVDGARRVEIGSGYGPTPGYIHVDINPAVPAVDLFSTARLPDSWADEVLAVHCVEHIPGPALRSTLESWLRLLAPGGLLRLHTPNAAALGRALIDLDGDNSAYWAALSAVYGYNLPPGECTGPAAFVEAPDHMVLFNSSTLVRLLEDAGFERVTDVSGRVPCAHGPGWAPYVMDMCLEVDAYKPSAP